MAQYLLYFLVMGSHHHTFVYSRTSLLFLYIICSLWASFAWSTENQCAEIFDIADITYATRREIGPDTPTVEIQGTLVDKDGSSLLVLRKTGASWSSRYTPNPDNYQGDPRWFAMLTNPNVAYFMGFRRISEDSMTAPTADTLNHKIQELNQKLTALGHEPIQIRFHKSSPTAEEGISYLQQIYHHFSLPMAPHGHYAIHDISYHSMAILLPGKILNPLRTRIGVLLRFHEKIEQDTSLSAMEKDLLKESVEHNVKEMVRYIDFGTGNIGFILTMEKTQQLNSRLQPFEAYDIKATVIDRLIHDTQRLITKLDENVDAIFHRKIKRVYATDDVSQYFSKTTTIEEREVMVRQIEKRLQEYMRKFLEEEKTEILSAQQHISTEEVVNFSRLRLKLIEEALP